MSHAIGLLLSVLGLIMLVRKASATGDSLVLLTCTVFGLSLVVLYGASTLYHSTREPAKRIRLRVVDHAAIYVLIAGSYTPITLLVLGGKLGWLIFGVSWAMAVTGITLKLFFTGHYKLLSTLMYVFMGWLIVFAIKPLINNSSEEGLLWIVAGGIAYTVGAILYSIKQIPFNHAIFHLFVVAGSFSHYWSVYEYVIPAAV